jgi:nucleotide-binding universal stress UspA family protein
LSEGRSAELARAEEERAAATLQFARHALVAAGAPDSAIREITLRGKPNDELRRLAEREEVALIVVGGRRGKPGPHSLGKTARFLVDHAPAAALLVR